MKDFKTFKKQSLQDPQVRREYALLAAEFSIAKSVIEKRMNMSMTQKELAQKVGTKQSAISRLESGRYNPSLAFLQKVATALNSELKIQL